MAKLDSRDYIQFSNTQVLNIIADEFEQIKATYIRKAYDQLQEIVSSNIRTTANFMYSFIEENLDLVLKDKFKNKYNDIEEDLVGMTNITCYQLDAAEDIDEVNRTVDNYKDFIENEAEYRVNLDALSEDFSSYLARYLLSRFDAYESPQLEEQIGDIKYQTRSYIDRMVENIYQEISNLVTRINVRQKDALKHYVAEFKKTNVKKMDPNNKYTEDFTHDTFTYNGKTIVYQYEGKDYNCYVDGVKITDPNKIMEINRQLQDEFPEAQLATDAMVNHVSSMLIDSKQQERDKGVESIADLLGTGTQSTNEVQIPEWMKPANTPNKTVDDLNKLTLDDYLEEEKKKESTPEEQAHVQELLDTLEIKDDPEPVRTPEEKQQIAEMANSLEIKDEEPAYDAREAGRLTEEELRALLGGLDIKDEPAKETAPVDKTEIQKMTESLEIKDEEETKTEVKDGDIGSIQQRMDELMKNPAVMEYLELQDMMKKYYDEYKQAVEQSIEPSMKPEPMEVFKLL